MPVLDLTRLSKVLALMGSPVDGEALAAARKAHALVEASGKSWADLLASPAAWPNSQIMQASTQPDGTRLTPPVGHTWRETATFLIQHCNRFVTRDARFVMRMSQDLQNPFRFPAPAEAHRLFALYRSLTPSAFE